MFKKVLNNKKGSVEIIVWMSILLVIVTMLFVLRTSISDMLNNTSDALNDLAVNTTVEEVEKPIAKEPIKEKPIEKEEPMVNQVTPIVQEKSLWDEIKVEVIAGIIVSVLGFGAGQLYSKFKHKKQVEIDDRLKTLNLNKYEM